MRNSTPRGIQDGFGIVAHVCVCVLFLCFRYRRLGGEIGDDPSVPTDPMGQTWLRHLQTLRHALGVAFQLGLALALALALGLTLCHALGLVFRETRDKAEEGVRRHPIRVRARVRRV